MAHRLRRTSSLLLLLAMDFTHFNPSYVTKPRPPIVPHRGVLCRVHVAPAAAAAAQPTPSSSSSVTSSRSSATTATAAPSFVYALPIRIPSPYANQSLELQFDRKEYDVLVRLFSILDSESRGGVEKEAVREFVGLRCPVFRRRDRTLRKFGRSTTTFDEAWDAVMECSSSTSDARECVPDDMAQLELGLEGWMVLCRLIALAQYQEAKRRFSERHSQQTMRHKAGGTEVVLVDVLPPDPPEPLHSSGLVQHQAESTTPLTLPEMDLDHCLLSAHDVSAEQELRRGKRARVEVKVFGTTKVGAKGGASALLASVSSSSPSAKSSRLEFVVTFYPIGDGSSPVVVRRSFTDMMWLNETFALHKKPGGTLCGRILPPFPCASRSAESSDEGKSSITGSVVAAGSSAAVAAASAGVGMITSVAKSAKSLFGSYVSSSSGKSTDAIGPGGGKTGRSGGWSYGRENTTISATDKAGQVERYLNYLLEHPALCTSFPLNVILKVSLFVCLGFLYVHLFFPFFHRRIHICILTNICCTIRSINFCACYTNRRVNPDLIRPSVFWMIMQRSKIVGEDSSWRLRNRMNRVRSRHTHRRLSFRASRQRNHCIATNQIFLGFDLQLKRPWLSSFTEF